jgi:transcriptional regulator with XRE-family HTH domain
LWISSRPSAAEAELFEYRSDALDVLDRKISPDALWICRIARGPIMVLSHSEIRRMPESVGVRLRQVRERRDIALAAIAEQTKIKLSLLQELERDEVCHWPTGIFRRAFIRSYAAAIGVDPEVTVREFLAEHPDPIELDEQAAASNGTDEVTSSAAPPTRFRYLVGSLLARVRGEALETADADVIAPVEMQAGAPRLIIPRPNTVTPPQAAAQEPPSIPPQTEALLPEPEPEPQPELAELPASAPGFDLQAIARLCTDLGQLDDIGQMVPLLEESALLLDAVGLIVWIWDGNASALIPLLSHGYSDKVLALVPAVRWDSDNATAAAFRSAQTCTVSGGDHASGAVVVALMASIGCIGVLAIELTHGREHQPSVHSLATILAAQLARLIDATRPLAMADRRLA